MYYTNVALQGNNILLRAVKNGRRINLKIQYSPKFYVPTKKPTQFKTLFNESLEELQFTTIREARDFKKKYDDVENFKIYGQERFESAFIADEFKEEIDWDIKNLSIAMIDIETGKDSSGQFADPQKGNGPLTAISIRYLNGNVLLFGCKDYEIQGNEKYIHCKDEYDLCKQFLNYWTNNYPDVVSGWNCLEGNQTVWFANKILRIQDLSNIYQNNPLFIDGSRINRYDYTGDKSMFKIKSCVKGDILCSGEHKFFVKTKNHDKYVRFSTLNKANEIECSVNDIKNLMENGNDVYLQLKFGNNVKNDITWRDLILEDSIWNRLMRNPHFDIPIKHEEIIPLVRQTVDVIDGYAWGSKFWKKHFVWNYKRNTHLWSEEQIKEQVRNEKILDFVYNNRRKTMDLDGVVSCDELKLLGFLFTDGTWDDNLGTMCFTQKNKETLELYSTIIKEKFSPKSITIKEVIRDRDVAPGIGYSMKLAATHMGILSCVVYDFDDVGKKYKNPDITLLSLLSKKQFMSFLTGTYDGDGYKCTENNASLAICNFDCSKFNYLNGLNELLLWNGFLSTVNHNQTILNILGNEKNIELIEYIKNNSCNKNRSDTINIDNIIDGSNKSFSKVLNYCYGGDILYSKIKQISDTNQIVPMYDIETPSHYFYTGGVKTHNSSNYDIPFIINRFKIVLGEDETKKLSPWNNVWSRTQTIQGKEVITHNITGIASLDYMELYKWGGKPKESYKLDFIASEELGENKLSYDEYDTLENLYEQNYQKFLEYNLRDTELLVKLEDKLKLIELVLTLAYDTKTNYEEVFSQTRMWDSLIYSYLLKDNIIMPTKTIKEKESAFEGAVVKEPKVGMHHWIASYDLDSLYSHTIMQYNISTETLIEPEDYTNDMQDIISSGVSVNRLLNKELDLSKLSNVTMTPNGQFFRTDIMGTFPKMLRQMYADRKKYKKMMLEASQEYEYVLAEISRRGLT